MTYLGFVREGRKVLDGLEGVGEGHAEGGIGQLVVPDVGRFVCGCGLSLRVCVRACVSVCGEGVLVPRIKGDVEATPSEE